MQLRLCKKSKSLCDKLKAEPREKCQNNYAFDRSSQTKNNIQEENTFTTSSRISKKETAHLFVLVFVRFC